MIHPIVFVIFVVSFLPGIVRGEDSLESLLRLLPENPELSVLLSRADAASARIPQAGSLDDPMLMFKLQNLLVREPWTLGGKDPQTATVVGISQTLPFPGKRGARESAALLDAQARRLEVGEKRLELVRMLKEGYYRLWGLDRSLELVERSIATLEGLAETARNRYAAGTGSQQEVLRATLEISRMHLMKTELGSERISTLAAVNTLLARPPLTPVDPPREIPLTVVTASVDELTAVARANRPRVAALARQEQKGRIGEELARLESYPDVTLSLEYMIRQSAMDDPGYDMVTAGVTIPLPVRGARRTGMREEAAAELRMAREEARELSLSVGREVAELRERLERERERIRLLREGVVPLSEQSLEAGLISYQGGKLDFAAVLEAWNALFQAEREKREGEVEYLMFLARLESVIGVDPTTVGGGEPTGGAKP